MSDKLEKQVRTVGLSLTAFLGPLAHCRDVTSLSYFYRYCFGRSSSELAKLVPLPHSCGRPNCYSNGMHDFFFVPIPRFYRDVYADSFFPCTNRHILPAECFSLTY